VSFDELCAASEGCNHGSLVTVCGAEEGLRDAFDSVRLTRATFGATDNKQSALEFDYY